MPKDPQLDEAQIGGLRKFFELLYPDIVHQDDFVKSFDRVLAKVREIEQKNAATFEGVKQFLSDLFTKLRSDFEERFGTLKADAESKVADLIARADDKLAAVDNRLAKVRDGLDADPEAIKQAVMAEMVLQDVKEAIVDTSLDLRNKLDLLPREEQPQAILDLEEQIAKLKKEIDWAAAQPRGTDAPGPMWALSDVDVTGITAGQALKWDGVRWIPFTPAGGATTTVYNEVVAGSGTSFTLANTPIAGSERLYANGQRLAPTTDYSITGAAITTVLSWSSGQLTADYDK